jgi:PBP1b-binding outer membrane lipoprotein LpoB
VQNRTAEHIDTRAITEKIRVQLIKSGQVLFVSSDRELEEVQKERKLDKEHTLRGENKPLLHTNYIVTGAVRGNTKKTPKGDAVITDYSIILELIHPESGMIYWTDEKEIRKRNTRASVGW